jgi:hypothetical protein
MRVDVEGATPSGVFMKIRTGTIVLTGTILLLQCIYAGAASAYNPNDDPNVVQGKAQSSAVQSAQVFTMVREFERLEPSNSDRSRESAAAAPQPALYAGSDLPAAPSQPLPYAAGPTDPYLWDVYHPFWTPAWNHPSATNQLLWHGRHLRWIPPGAHSSPRIPWWSILRFTKH